jgi:pseudouridine-5'-monophosphatase
MGTHGETPLVAPERSRYTTAMVPPADLAARLPRPVRAVIYDMDGLLLDTEGFYTLVTQEICGRYGKTFDWAVKAHMVGRPALDAARYLVDRLALPIAPEDYLREREGRLVELFPSSAAMPGARALTDAVATRGVPQAVATSSNARLFALKTTRHTEWFRVFQAVVRGDDPRVRHGKPAPDIFLVAASGLGIAPADCVVLEDATVGVAAARAAGMQVIAVPDPATDPAGFVDADLVVPSLTALPLAALRLVG